MGNSISTKSIRSTLFTEKKTQNDLLVNLAPLTRVASDDEESECPICFSNYEALNIVVCCKGKICTSCHLELTSLKSSEKKNTTNIFECPFCSSSGYKVKFSSFPKTSPEKSVCSSSVSTPNESSNNNQNTISRSSSTRKSMQIVLASVEDRQQLENEIKSQRKINSRPISATHSMTSSRSSRSYSIDSNHFPNSNSAYSTPLGQGTPISTSALSHSTRHPMRSTASAQEVSLDQLMHSIMSGMQTHSAAIESIADFGDAESLEQLMILQAIQMSLRDTGNAETVSSASSNSNKLSNANSSSATLSELKESACPDPQDDQKPLSSPLSSSLNQLFSNTEHPATDPSCMQDLTSGLNGAMSCGSLVIKPSKSDEGWKVFADVNDESTHSASDLPLLSISNEDNISAEQSRDSQNGIVEKFDDYYLSMFNS